MLNIVFPLSNRSVAVSDINSTCIPPDELLECVQTAVALYAETDASNVQCSMMMPTCDIIDKTMTVAVVIRVSGGKGGFAKQLQRMGKEFRLQRQMARRAQRTQGPGEGVYRDLQGRRVVVVGQNNRQHKQGQQQQEQTHTADTVPDDEQRAKSAAAAENPEEVAQAAREAKENERRNLVMKIIAAVREGTSERVVQKQG